MSEFSSFLRLSTIPLCVYTTFCLYVQLLVDTDCSHFLAIVSIIAVNMGVRVPVVHYSEVELRDQMTNCCIVSIVAALFLSLIHI